MPTKATRETISGNTSRRYTEVTVGDVQYRLQSLTVNEYLELVQSKPVFESDILVAMLVDDDGEQLFSLKSESDRRTVGNLGADVGMPLRKAAWDHLGIVDEPPEDMVKNSDGAVSNDS